MYHEKRILNNSIAECRKDIGINRKTNPTNRYRRIHRFASIRSLLLLYRMGGRNGHGFVGSRYPDVLFFCHIVVDIKRLLQYLQSSERDKRQNRIQSNQYKQLNHIKMKNLVYAFVAIAVSVMHVSCTNNKQIVEVAEKYVSEQICPLLPDASVSEYTPLPMPVNPVNKVKGKVNQVNLTTAKEKSLLDTKQLDVATGIQSLSEFKNRIIVHRLIQSDINALKKANAEQGFYVVWVNIKYDNDKYESFDIVVSKDLKVLNAPIDMSEVNTTVEKMKDVYTE